MISLGNIESDRPDAVATGAVADSIAHLLKNEQLCALATLNEDLTPHINNAYFAQLADCDLTIWSSPKTQHCRNIERHGAVAISIFSTETSWGADVHGLQMFGEMRLATGADAARAFRAYASKYVGLTQWAKAIDDADRMFESRFYSFHTRKIKLIDERRFGKENYVVASTS